MGRIERQIEQSGIAPPEVPVPHANYLRAKQSGNLVFTAGQPSHGFIGKLGADLDEETGRAATRTCALNCVAAIRSAFAASVYMIVEVEQASAGSATIGRIRKVP